MELIKELWRGDIPLSRTFWLFGFGVNLLLTIALLYLSFQAEILTTTIGMIFYFLLLLCSILYGPFILIAIWRSANKYQGFQRNAIAAKIMVIIGWGKYLQSLAELAKEFSG
jgi:phosphoglycerol transferase MdoB-like AlkP superfamily enzyme